MQSATYEGQLYLDAVTKSLLTTLLKYLTFYTRSLETIHDTIIYSTFKGSNSQNKKKFFVDAVFLPVWILSTYIHDPLKLLFSFKVNAMKSTILKVLYFHEL